MMQSVGCASAPTCGCALAPAVVPAFLQSRDDYALARVQFPRASAGSGPLGLGLEHVALGTPSSSIVIDEYIQGSVVERAGGVQVGSIVCGVNGRSILGSDGVAAVGAIDTLSKGISAADEVQLDVIRPRSIGCILTMVCALRRRELDRHVPPALRRRMRRRRQLQLQQQQQQQTPKAAAVPFTEPSDPAPVTSVTRREVSPSASAASASASAPSICEHHALIRLFTQPGSRNKRVDLSGWLRRTVHLERGASGLGLGIVHVGLGTIMVDSVVPGLAAESAGVHVGAVLASVDGCDCRQLDFDQVSAKLRGVAGSRVSLEVLQPRTLQSLLVTFLTLQRMLLDDGCEVDYQWWGEGGADVDEADEETWSEDDIEAIDGLESGSASEWDGSEDDFEPPAHESSPDREHGGGVHCEASAPKQPRWVQAPATSVLGSGATSGIVREAVPVHRLAPAPLGSSTSPSDAEQASGGAFDTCDTTAIIEIVIES